MYQKLDVFCCQVVSWPSPGCVSASDLETYSLPLEVGWIDLSILTQLCCDCGSAKHVPMNNPLGVGLCIDF